MRYFHRWPVIADDMRLSDLHAEAMDDLHEELEARGLIAFGDIVFTLESVETPEGGDLLELHAAVEVVAFRKDAAA